MSCRRRVDSHYIEGFVSFLYSGSGTSLEFPRAMDIFSTIILEECEISRDHSEFLARLPVGSCWKCLVSIYEAWNSCDRPSAADRVVGTAVVLI